MLTGKGMWIYENVLVIAQLLAVTVGNMAVVRGLPPSAVAVLAYLGLIVLALVRLRRAKNG